ncbi:MAG: hypothetical protein ABGY95_02710 [Rubritalea sp.]|uniref:hypothetical protein n=1 Tax=Rubritalea sp. TaxID=2109375 RepID=UPI00324250A7
MKIKYLILGFVSLLPLTTLTSCVEAVALAAIAVDLTEGEDEEIPERIMHEGAYGNYPVARRANGSSTHVHNPFNNKPVNVFGKPSGVLLGSGSKKFYIPHFSQYPTATKVKGKPGYYVNPYDKREVRMTRSKPGALVASPTAGTFFYLPK